MPKREQVKKQAPQEKQAETAHSEGGEQADLSATDDLLDEIDSILEEQEVLISYRQKGGQLVQTAWENVKGGFRETVLQVWRGAGIRLTTLR